MPLVLPGEEVSLNEPGRTFARHHHLSGYAALVVSGACNEAGDRGRFRACAGDVLVHLAFEAHQDQIGSAGAKIINFPIEEIPSHPFGFVADLDSVVRLHERDPAAAAQFLREQFGAHPGPNCDWPDLLARELSLPNPRRLDDWAELHELNPSSLSRGFKRAYGVTPKRYRFEQMVSRAARELRESFEGLSRIAAGTGFADQAHMTRAMAQLFGITPQRLRRLS
jgi:AraC-like DNA-binding protein